MSAAPWSVKGIDPKAREVAKDLARRSGLTLGEWLNSMIMEDDDDDIIPMPRRSQQIDGLERRARSRRLDDAYAQDEIWLRVSASVDALASRLETAEHRSTAAIQGVDQAVAGLLKRLDGQDAVTKAGARRVEEIAEELREGHRRLRHFEKEVAPQTAETFGKVETSIGALGSRLYDMEERQRQGVNELRQRLDIVEKAAPTAGLERASEFGQRLDEAQTRTSEALRSLERSFASLDLRLRDAESRVEPEGAREAARFEKLAEGLSRQVETSRAEMMRRLDTAETEGRLERIERVVQAMGDQARAAEERSARAVEAMGQEILRIAQNLNGRVAHIESADNGRLEQLGQGLTRKVQAEVARANQTLEASIDQRLTASDDRHAAALERLGGEITRISDRLSERIAQTERRSQEALDDIGKRLADSSSRIEQRHERTSGELADRMRQSEERTASLIAEARQNIDRRGEVGRAAPVVEAEPDWRAAAFPDSAFPDAAFAGPFAGATFPDPVAAYEADPTVVEQQAWSDDLAAPSSEAATDDFAEEVIEPAPFGSVAEAEPPTVRIEAKPTPPGATTPFGAGFGGADVADALAATQLLDDVGDEFAGETEFVDARALRTAAAKGRAESTRQAVSAARAAMNDTASTGAADDEGVGRSAFGLKRGGKSRLQERMDRQSGGTIRKALGASAVAVVLAGGGAIAFSQLAAGGEEIEQTTGPIAALAVGSGGASAARLERGAELYQQAIAQLDGDDARGPQTLKSAADQGYPQAQLHLASLYQDGGKGLDPNPGQARLWAKRAAEGGDVRGMHAYGMYLFDGVGGSPAPAAALTWLKRAAERGLVDSQYNVARLYETGADGIPSNPGEAFKWYLLASRAGDPDAQASVERLRASLPASVRGQARAAADRITIDGAA